MSDLSTGVALKLLLWRPKSSIAPFALVVAFFTLWRSSQFRVKFCTYLRYWVARAFGSRSHRDPFIRLSEGDDRGSGTHVFADFYSVGEQIAAGTFGAVYRCCRIGHKNDSFLVKIVARDRHPLMRSAATSHARGAFGRRLATSSMPIENETRDFRKYMRTLLSLRHVNVVRYPQFFADHTSFYFVMERCPGVELLEFLMTKSEWYESDGRMLAQQMLEGLRYIHSCGIMHRDIKLENLMVHREDSFDGKQFSMSLKLVDFGLGCNIGVAGGIVGTPGFTAPEIYGRGLYTEVVDIFSAGVVLYILLTGRPPFRAPINMQHIGDHVQSLMDGPDLTSRPFLSISNLCCRLLDTMMLPNPVFRWTAKRALNHDWFRVVHRPDQPILWHSSSSEVHFLRVMGVWEGTSKCSKSLSSCSLSLAKINELGVNGEDLEQSQILESLCASIVHQLPIPVCVADPSAKDCPIVAVSRGFVELTGFSFDQCIGKNCRFLNETRDAEMTEETRTAIRRAIRQEITFLGVLPNSKADGTPFNNLLHLSPLDLGSKTYMVGVGMEVKDPNVFPQGHRREEALAIVRKAHSAIRHWVRSSQCGFGACKLRA
mmetsp:Transcript_102274/g.161562  ORF Transcript_102274/g.161562 Transcript_102274/m.161562 type:complete len:599 (-) Transcript_102274:102-1898(-)